MHLLPLPDKGLRSLLIPPDVGDLAPDLVLERQHSVLTHKQAIDCGFTRSAVRHRLEVGQWQVVHPQVYATYAGPLSAGTLIWGALLHAGAGAVLDGPTALGVHGLTRYDDPRVHILVPHHRHPDPTPGVVIRRSRTLGIRTPVEREGFPVLRIERAALTVARDQPRRAGSVLTAVVQQGYTTAEKLRGYLLDLGPVHGRGELRTILDDIEGGSRSELERRFHRLIRRHNLPRPIANYRVVLEGRVFYLDNAWPD